MDNTHIIEINKAFPIPVPEQEEGRLEILSNGMNFFFQVPVLGNLEEKAFGKGFNTYTYFETPMPAPVAIWVFDFPETQEQVRAAYNAQLANSEMIKLFLDSDSPNSAMFYLLNRQLVKGMKAVGLHPEAILLFKNTLRKQINAKFSEHDFMDSLIRFYRLSPQEFLERGGKSFNFDKIDKT